MNTFDVHDLPIDDYNHSTVDLTDVQDWLYYMSRPDYKLDDAPLDLSAFESLVPASYAPTLNTRVGDVRPFQVFAQGVATN
ncbi:hypothetical protein LEN26_021355 [Aphanomyces euteiches]|nr:hypothetical protein LEN26_021355 [Aphanomyces euteiches]KAH9103236.1 hypothetical protein AeMF1_020374 [Aphanomyces euteiches]KAH9189411.1 hypothetical protein AeNC1_008619 [Aphanomyces euteiches]